MSYVVQSEDLPGLEGVNEPPVHIEEISNILEYIKNITPDYMLGTANCEDKVPQEYSIHDSGSPSLSPSQSTGKFLRSSVRK